MLILFMLKMVPVPLARAEQARFAEVDHTVVIYVAFGDKMGLDRKLTGSPAFPAMDG
jgi:hypothetical protein